MPLKKNVIDEQSVNDNNYKELKRLFPHAVSIDENGKYSIDPEKLQMSLDPSLAEIKEEGYGLNWVGKKEAYHTAFSKNQKVLKPLQKQSKDWDATGNILLKGDNLDALKILRQNYFEAIKMIYIDPPYNTKNDGFVYNDNFTETTEETLEALGYDKEYVDYIENIQGAKTHSGWLSFMYPRLLLAKDLLKEDGVIFISIDDNEVAQLRLLCDEVFGEENFISTIVNVNNPKGRSDDGFIATSHEYGLIYKKNEAKIFGWKPDEKIIKRFNKKDEGGRIYREIDLRKTGDNDRREDRPNLFYYFLFNEQTNDLYISRKEEIPNGYIQIKPIKENGQEGNWRWEEKTALEKFNLLIPKYMKVRERWGIFEKDLLENKKNIKPTSTWTLKEVNSERGSEQFINLGFKKEVFKNPKPLGLIQKIMEFGLGTDEIILDFFAGSGTTAHAVMDLNAKDNGNRKFICVQWAEETPEKSEARKAGYENIFDITQERIRRAGEQIGKGDIGFRTFEVVEDVKQKLYQKPLDQASQEDLLSFSQTPSIESHEEILYNLLVAESLSLSSKVEVLMEQKLYRVENVLFILGSLNIDELVTHLKALNGLEYITVYSPLVDNDKFTLELESAVEQMGIKGDKLRFRG
ncbi:MAG: Type III restriction-modification system methylation subunit (EC [uncultured Sulfurovum sp.]|uniref:site-specific DNA-methyltransferase (adenine-specific) n=1 Tax=uncultured Sulfurovum sp. TaxID=269237 RepID=A0A6S6SMV1_9BACT|nr:MAG: Type III restriction-modification system methylation subunit (EC [uncultured Sulfurovum sp.]